MVINTHPDADHLAGLVSLLERFEIEQAMVSDVAGTSQLYREWEAGLAEARLIPAVSRAGMRLAFTDAVTAHILSPGPDTVEIDEANNHSVVLRLQYGRISFLLSGDIEEVVDRRLSQNHRTALAATVLKSPHHGSKTSSSEAFLAAVDPQLVAVSVGEENRFGHPSPEVLERYAEHGLPVLRTDEHGTIEFITDGERLWVETAR